MKTTIPKNIKGILLDVDGTLYYQTPLRLTIMFYLFFSNCYNPSKLFTTLKIIYYYRKAQEVLRRSNNNSNKNHIAQIEYAATKSGKSTSIIDHIVKEWFEEKPLIFLNFFKRRGLNSALKSWNKAGLKLGVFSDYPAENKLKALGISKFISTVSSAGDKDVSGFKPNTNGFIIAAKKMNLQPSEILYIGDRYEVDGVGALKSNMKVIIIKSFLGKKIPTKYDSSNSFYDLANTTI